MTSKLFYLTLADCRKLQDQLQKLRGGQKRLGGSATAVRIHAEIARLEASIEASKRDLEQIQERINQRQAVEDADSLEPVEDAANRRMPNESQRDFLIRTGKITPFSKDHPGSLSRSKSTLQGILLNVEDEESKDEALVPTLQFREPLSHRDLKLPGFTDCTDSEVTSDEPDLFKSPAKRRRLCTDAAEAGDHQPSEDSASTEQDMVSEDSTFSPNNTDEEIAGVDNAQGVTKKVKDNRSNPNTFRSEHKSQKTTSAALIEDLRGLDDGDERIYQQRLHTWTTRRSAAREKTNAKKSNVISGESDVEAAQPLVAGVLGDNPVKEWHLPHPSAPDTTFEGGYRAPGDVFPSLFDYQKTGVQWLWELYSQEVGGIVGDEMGLGKTIQIIAFLAGLHYSQKITRPILIVAPATLMKQWVNEFHTWWPPFRVSILHTSGSGMVDIGREARLENDLLSEVPASGPRNSGMKGQKAAQKIVDRVVKDGHVLITTYTGLQTYADLLIPVNWEYAVLDEGHKIRNPNTAITIYCKELRTPNRIILSGTPMQNNLIELWSLFDFVFPMRLGTLVNFRQMFEFPIRQGGYANASNLQIQTAIKCAEALKDAISPYLLQRFKADVASDLPKKTERVLFCKLTKSQREAYERFLYSDDLKAIMNGKRQILYGIDILRKICNHPDLQEHRTLSVMEDYDYGTAAKSGKMQVVRALLELWKEQGNKALLFAQHRIMLDILEKFIKSMPGFNVRRMDGNTPISSRQTMVDEFNDSADAHVFLLTTKVGGLGINLTGANRVIIYDPDWNPSTDIQARERAWRLGQKREVMIYRLMTAGTIEEKIYHRQLFKQFLTNKILRDPQQRQTFQIKDLHDLFTLGGANDAVTETSELFKGTEVKFHDSIPSPSASAALANRRRKAVGPTQNASESGSAVGHLTGVVSEEPFDADEGKEGHAAADKIATNSESRVLEGIFARTGVHSALEHDQIINGKRVVTADPKIIEREAKKIAAQAANALRKAGETARAVPIGTPTWTGQYGIAGRPEERMPAWGRGGPSSSTILAGLQDHQGVGNRENGPRYMSSRAGDGKNVDGGRKGIDFKKLIRDFLVARRGPVYTQMLIDHFNRHCDTPERTVQFKEMLREIARLEKGSRGRGKWVLKEEYQPRG